MLQVGRERMQQPGELPVPESEDDELIETGRLRPVTVDDRRMQKGVHDPRSPKKPRNEPSEGTVAINMEALRGLFAEQAAAIGETQRVAIGEAVSSLRSNFEGYRDEIRREVQQHAEKVSDVQAQMRKLVERVDKLERGAAENAAGGTGTGDDKHLYTLVYGGWPRESARKDILSNLDETLHKLELRALTDTAAFTTGPRKLQGTGRRDFCVPEIPHGEHCQRDCHYRGQSGAGWQAHVRYVQQATGAS